MNIQFDYLYRDAGNYKRWGTVVFSNQQNTAVIVLNQRIIGLLDEQLYFVATNAQIPDLHFAEFDITQDHNWHEFASVEATTDSPTDSQGRDINQFIADLANGDVCNGQP